MGSLCYYYWFEAWADQALLHSSSSVWVAVFLPYATRDEGGGLWACVRLTLCYSSDDLQVKGSKTSEDPRFRRRRLCDAMIGSVWAKLMNGDLQTRSFLAPRFLPPTSTHSNNYHGHHHLTRTRTYGTAALPLYMATMHYSNERNENPSIENPVHPRTELITQPSLQQMPHMQTS